MNGKMTVTRMPNVGKLTAACEKSLDFYRKKGPRACLAAANWVAAEAKKIVPEEIKALGESIHVFSEGEGLKFVAYIGAGRKGFIWSGVNPNTGDMETDVPWNYAKRIHFGIGRNGGALTIKNGKDHRYLNTTIARREEIRAVFNTALLGAG